MTVDRRDNYTPGWKYNFWELRVGGWGVGLGLGLGLGTRLLWCCCLVWGLVWGWSPSNAGRRRPSRRYRVAAAGQQPSAPAAPTAHVCRPCPPPPCAPLQGVPLRIELGPRDMEGGVAMLARRDSGAKESAEWGALAARVPQLLETIQVGGGGAGAPTVRATRGGWPGLPPARCITLRPTLPPPHLYRRPPLPCCRPLFSNTPSLPPTGRHVRQGARAV